MLEIVRVVYRGSKHCLSTYAPSVWITVNRTCHYMEVANVEQKMKFDKPERQNLEQQNFNLQQMKSVKIHSGFLQA